MGDNKPNFFSELTTTSKLINQNDLMQLRVHRGRSYSSSTGNVMRLKCQKGLAANVIVFIITVATIIGVKNHNIYLVSPITCLFYKKLQLQIPLMDELSFVSYLRQGPHVCALRSMNGCARLVACTLGNF